MTDKKHIGFIGAGKVGFSLGRYLMEHHMDVSGYYSQNPKSAQEAAKFTHTKFFEKLDDVVDKSEVIFLTVPDHAIKSVWEALKQHARDSMRTGVRKNLYTERGCDHDPV